MGNLKGSTYYDVPEHDPKIIKNQAKIVLTWMGQKGVSVKLFSLCFWSAFKLVLTQ